MQTIKISHASLIAAASIAINFDRAMNRESRIPLANLAVQAAGVNKATDEAWYVMNTSDGFYDVSFEGDSVTALRSE